MEESMKFNSQICTTREQSQRLLALGLKPETADMHHYKWTEGYWDIYAWPPRGSDSCYIPAWSLHRLMEIGNIENAGFANIKKAYDTCISLIASHIKFGLLNKEYLKK